jgi:hypothetical protein
MTRYKGRTSPEAVERDFPHHVEMIVPLGGFGKKAVALRLFSNTSGFKSRKRRYVGLLT